MVGLLELMRCFRLGGVAGLKLLPWTLPRDFLLGGGRQVLSSDESLLPDEEMVDALQFFFCRKEDSGICFNATEVPVVLFGLGPSTGGTTFETARDLLITAGLI